MMKYHDFLKESTTSAQDEINTQTRAKISPLNQYRNALRARPAGIAK